MAMNKIFENQLSEEDKAIIEKLSPQVKKAIAISSIMDARTYNTLFEEVSSSDFQKMTVKLAAHLERIVDREAKQGAKSQKEAIAAEQARAAVQKIIKEQGLDITPEQLLGEATSGASKPKSKRSYGSIAPKYRLVDGEGNITQWTGRGIKPKVIQEYLAKGGKLDELLIPDEDA